MTTSVLHIDSSARLQGSITRELSAKIVQTLNAEQVTYRDLAVDALPQIDETWVGANFTPADQRTDAQRDVLAQSDALIAELNAADTIVIGAPIYNFSVPTSVKAWIDLIARAGVTFQYTEKGPKGLLEGKRVILAVASGGTAVGSEIDFASSYLRHVMGFVGIDNVEIIAADQLGANDEIALQNANEAINALAA